MYLGTPSKALAKRRNKKEGSTSNKRVPLEPFMLDVISKGWMSAIVIC
jgi:hypothetical protein